MENDRDVILGYTKKESKPIEQVFFDETGRYIITCSRDSLKVWDISSKFQLKKNIDVKWKSVFDAFCDEESKKVLALAENKSGFGLWRVNWMSSDSDLPISPPTYTNGE